VTFAIAFSLDLVIKRATAAKEIFSKRQAKKNQGKDGERDEERVSRLQRSSTGRTLLDVERG
jgi:hypothetical protein